MLLARFIDRFDPTLAVSYDQVRLWKEVRTLLTIDSLKRRQIHQTAQIHFKGNLKTIRYVIKKEIVIITQFRTELPMPYNLTSSRCQRNEH